jgi:energy-coupling factor transport system ATP-binding protein
MRFMRSLSGGEAVRVALSSVAAQGVEELHIDTSLEQLDEHWRRSIFALVATPSGQIAKQLFIADNHLSQEEICTFDDALHFPLNREKNDRWSQAIDPAAAAAHVCAASAAMTISVEHVSFSYARKSPIIFHQVSIALEPGDLYFLLGPNGSGKTTFVKLLSGTLLPRKGIIRIGTDIFQPSKSPYRFAGVAFQNPDFQWTTQTVEGELTKVQSGASSRSLQAILPTFGIPEELFQAHPNELPFVLKKRLGIALSVIGQKPWLIFDEPTLGQDKEFREAFAEFVRLVLDRGTGVIMISHDTYFRSICPKSKKLSFGKQAIVPAG